MLDRSYRSALYPLWICVTMTHARGLYAVHPLGKYYTIALQNKCTSCYVHQEAFYGLALFDFIKKLLICKNY